jgi:LysM repeat protein
MRFSQLLLSCLVILAVVGCGDDFSRGVVITGDGRVTTNTPAHERDDVARVLREAVVKDLGVDWGVAVAIPDLPEWIQDNTLRDGEWVWPRLSATVRLTPPVGGQLTEAKRAELIEGTRAYLEPKLAKPVGDRLSVAIEQLAAPALAATPAAAAPAAAAPPQPTVVPATAARSYTLQANDTLADISTAFYGSPQHWRLIQEANPGLDPAALRPGQVLVIPPKP